MGFTPTFYAARPKLSEVTIDSDLNMGGRNISGVDTLRADLIRAGQVDAPYMPQTWPTEELEWDDIDEYSYDNLPGANGISGEGYKTILDEFETPPERQYLWEIFANRQDSYGRPSRLDIINIDTSEVIASTPIASAPTTTKVVLPPGVKCSVKFIGTDPSWRSTLNPGSYVKNTGKEWLIDDKTFSLTGMWLALGIDMHGLDATVKIQGVEIPYSDYAKYFPLAPTELKIPGNWDATQTRPDVEVYV